MDLIEHSSQKAAAAAALAEQGTARHCYVQDGRRWLYLPRRLTPVVTPLPADHELAVTARTGEALTGEALDEPERGDAFDELLDDLANEATLPTGFEGDAFEDV